MKAFHTRYPGRHRAREAMEDAALAVHAYTLKGLKERFELSVAASAMEDHAKEMQALAQRRQWLRRRAAGKG